MKQNNEIAIVSDVHYASAAERARSDYCLQAIRNPPRRFAVRWYRHFYWLRDSFAHNHLLDVFIDRAKDASLVIANGDYSCDSAFVGLSDDASFESARECLGKMRKAFGERLLAVIGDHELGKMPLGSATGGLRLASYYRTTEDLGLEPFWKHCIGDYTLMGVTATLISLPIHEEEALPRELEEWRRLRDQHLDAVRQAFAELGRGQRVILFCHDPTALPFLAQDEVIRAKLSQIDRTVIGHLHSPLVYWQSRLLCGMPVISGFGHTAKRLSSALRQARYWKPFHVTLCPSLAGIELLKDGGYLTMDLANGVATRRHRIPRRS